MHRSGTSATTRVLNLLGAELGTNLLDPQSDNLKGFWEHHDAVQIHERLLSELGRDWHDLRELPADWMELPASLKAMNEIAELVRRDFSGVRLWAIKDPRMCRLAPLWIRTLDQLGIRSTALIVLRDPREVAASLHAREGWSYDHSWLMWVQHVVESIEATRHIPRAILEYDDLLKDWASSVARVGLQLRVSWPYGVGHVRQEIETFLSPADRHHQVRDDVQGRAEAVPPPQRLMQLAQLCADVAAGTKDWSDMESLCDEFQSSAKLFAGPIAELTKDREALRRIVVERLEVIGRVHGELAEHSHHLKRTIAALHQKTSELEGATRVRNELQSALSAKSIMTDELQHQLEDLTSKHRALGEVSQAQYLEKLLLQQEQATLVQESIALRQRGAYVEERLERARIATRSRRWLLRRIAQLTFRGSTLKDVDFR